LWLTGNPVYPTNPFVAVEVLRPDSLRPIEHERVPLYRIPWMIHFDGQRAFDIGARHPMGVFFIFFFPAWLFARRRKRRPAETVCLLFVAAYLLYWGAVWPVVRYAIAPFLILTLLTVERLRSFHDQLGKPARWLTTGALFYCMFVSLLVIGVLEVNPDQFRLWTNSITQQEYLRRNFVPYPSLQYLKQHASTEDEILSVNSDTRAYAPDLLHFHPYMPREGGTKQGVLEKLAERDYRYLLLRRARWAQGIEETLAESGAQIVHRDRYFLVFELQH